MSYSIISLLALILNLIINRETLKSIRARGEERENEQRAVVRYRRFLAAANCYFVTDIGWGILYEFRHIDAVFPFLYLDCSLYFLFLFLTMPTWISYVLSHLNRLGLRNKILLRAMWTVFALAPVYLVINYFHPFIFSFDRNHDYVTEPGRHVAFALHFVLYVVTSIYMFYAARKSSGGKRTRNIAVALTCLVMELFLILQILDPMHPFYAMGLLVGICVIHSFVEAKERKEKEIYDNIATSLAEDYEAMYYIDIESGRFREFSVSRKYESLNVPMAGQDFYAETRANVEKFVHPDDKEFAKNLHQKETMLKILAGKKSYSYKYRLMIDGQPKHFQFTLMLANDGKHFVLSEKDIEDEITAERLRLENQKQRVTFTQIAEILAVNYDMIYYVDAKDSSYISYECRNIYGRLDMQKSGDDFFADSQVDIPNIVHKGDRDLVLEFVNKDHIVNSLMDKKACGIDYRIMAFGKTHYARMTVRKTADDTHYVIGVENIDDEVKREKRHLKSLNTEKELARRDELTGVKNKTAYNELEKSVQANIDNGMDYLPFGLVVCDANDLKAINDTQGHVAGDEYIKKSAMLLCNTFVHSPVFRIGGDEFVVFLRGSDYSNREALMKSLRAQVLENQRLGVWPVLASGMAEYVPETDTLMAEIFDRADKEMYKNKRDIKKEEKNLGSKN